MTTTTKKKSTKTSIEKLQPDPFQHEILELASKQRSNAKKVEVLKEYMNDGLVSILIWNFDPSLSSALPPGEVPYATVDGQTSIGGNLTDMIDSKAKNVGKKSTGYFGTEEFAEETSKTSIRNEFRNFYIYINGGNSELSQIRKETMFINLLQGLHPLEAELLCLVKDKNLTTKYKISFENVKQACPNITWGGRV